MKKYISVAILTVLPLFHSIRSQTSSTNISNGNQNRKQEVSNDSKNNQYITKEEFEEYKKNQQNRTDYAKYFYDWLQDLKIVAGIRFRPELRYNYDFDKSTDDHKEWVGSRLQLGVEKNIIKTIHAKILLQDSRVFGGTPGSKTGVNTANADSTESVDVREGWFEVNSPNKKVPLSLKVGRQILDYGDRRLVGNGDWQQVGRSWDGFLGKFDTKIISSHAWVMVMAEEDSDSNRNITAVGASNPSGLAYNCNKTGSTCSTSARVPQELDDSYFTGWFNTIKPSKHLQMDLYYLGMSKKWKKRVLGSNELLLPGATITTQDRDRQNDDLYTFGFKASNRTQEGNKAVIPIDWSFEYMAQKGVTGVRVTPGWDYLNTQVSYTDNLTGATVRRNIYSEKQKYDAFAYVVTGGFTVKKMIRFGFDYTVASGDSNRNDGKVTTFNALVGAGHDFYGLADQTTLSNMKGQSVNINFFSKKYGNLKLAYWQVDKFKLQDSWYTLTGSVTNITTESQANSQYGNTYNADGTLNSLGSGYLKKHLFKEYDLVYNIKLLSINWGLGYAKIFAGDAAKGGVDNYFASNKITNNFNRNGDFAYLMMNYVF